MEDIVVDITGGAKVMGAVVTMAASERRMALVLLRRGEV
ncbi:MAG: hypothetical protein PWQ82_1403 [Thermosediminibacterales bacterium]|nr:hypothetical protein [Thermosediminibacterales bacterium]MDK2836505.1 hypothetical protein [Thermosediminibacterales bacterium]